MPIPGLSDHCTPVFVEPVTAAVNCCVCPDCRLTDPGVVERLIAAMSAIIDFAVFVESAMLTTRISIVWDELITPGAV